MKKYEEAELEVLTFENNIITTSGDCSPDLNKKTDEISEIPEYCTDGILD